MVCLRAPRPGGALLTLGEGSPGRFQTFRSYFIVITSLIRHLQSLALEFWRARSQALSSSQPPGPALVPQRAASSSRAGGPRT